jgi:septal ring factor EnvC (AmiA/AmiB activator)
MKNYRKLIAASLTAVLLIGSFTFTGCSGVSEEQMAQLQALRTEVKALEKEIADLKVEKTKLEREIAEKNAKLDECNKLKAEIKANMDKSGK